MTVPLRSLHVSGFRSLRDLELDLTSPVTILAGANGSGKSNIVDAFELLGRAVDGQLNDHLLRIGGFGAVLHSSMDDVTTEEITLTVWGDWHSTADGSDISNGYRMRLTVGPDDTALIDETTLTHRKPFPTPYDSSLGRHKESVLRSLREDHDANAALLDVLTGCRVFHFDDTSADAPPLRRIDVADGLRLHHDARNIAAVLRSIRDDDKVRYSRIIRSIQSVAPFFDDFVLEPAGGSLILRWRERGLDSVFSGSALSSGTLRFICLAVLLQQPDPPATIVLDEPELGLHPFAIHQVAQMMRETAQNARLVAATQSVTLLSQFNVDEVAVVERVRGATTVERPDPAALAAWLDDYSLGELWEKNILGGRPRPHDAPRRSG